MAHERIETTQRDYKRDKEGKTDPEAKDRRNSISELSIVVLRHPIEHDGKMLPKGGTGTIVHAYNDGEHYEVEFVEPFPCVVTVERDDIQPV